MFIHKLHLENWRSYKDTTLAFGKVNLIRGLNNSGKSSLACAIEYVLAGRCLGLDEAGKGAQAMIRNGAKQGAIQADIGTPQAVNAVLTRTRSASTGNVTMKANGQEYAGRQVEEILGKHGFSKQVLSAALRAGRFLSLSPAEQKELLAETLKPEPVLIPSEIGKLIDSFGRLEPYDRIDLEQARKMEEGCTKLRAECTAALREVGEPEEVPAPAKDQPTADQVRGRLDALRNEQSTAVREKERLEGRWAERAERRRKLPKLIAEAAKAILTDEAEKKYLEVMENESKVNTANFTLERIATQIKELENQIAGAMQGGKCPTCGHETDTEELAKRFQESIGALQSRIPALRGTVDKYGDTTAAKAALRSHREACTDRDRYAKELEGLGGAEAVPDTKKLTAQIEELEGRIQKGQGILARLAADEERREAYLRAVAQRKQLEARREAADTLAKWAGPSGVQAQMASGKLGPFTEAINLTLGRFGYACSICLDPYSIQGGRTGSNQSFELGSLSESEAWRFSVAFQTAIAKVTGLNLAVFDRADVLVGANRGLLVQTVLDCGLDQVFLFASVDNKAKMPDSVTVFDLSLGEDGTTICAKTQ